MPSFRGWVHSHALKTAKVTPGYPNPHDIIDATWNALRDRAEGRARRALVEGMGAVDQYHHDAMFHHAIDVIAQAAVAGVFGEFPLTSAEQEAKLQAFHVLLDAMPAWDPSWTATSQAKSKSITMDDIKKAADQIKADQVKAAKYGQVVMGTPQRPNKKPWPAKSSGLPAAQEAVKAEEDALAVLAARVERKSDELLGIKQKAKYEELAGIDPEDI